MKPKVFLLILLTTLFCCSVVYGECPEGDKWVESWYDGWGVTYSIEAPCKVYIGIPFDITATVTSTTCGDGWVASFWAIIDNGLVIDGCTDCQNSIIINNGQWQRVITQTYTGDPVDHQIEFQFTDHSKCFGFHSVTENLIGNITVDPTPGVSLGCVGYEPPLNESPVKFKKNRALPLKAQLLDTNGLPVTDADIIAPPVVQVLYDPVIQGNPIDISNSVLPAGHATDGNQFIFTEEGEWQFNLGTKSYTAPGTYSVLMETGDTSEYSINPTCTVEFIIE